MEVVAIFHTLSHQDLPLLWICRTRPPLACRHSLPTQAIRGSPKPTSHRWLKPSAGPSKTLSRASASKCPCSQSAPKCPIKPLLPLTNYFFGGGYSMAPAIVAGAGAAAIGGGLAMAARISGSAKDGWVPCSAMAARAPCSTVDPGTSTNLEASCPVSMSLEASRAPPPSPLNFVWCGTRLLGGGGWVMSDLCPHVLCFHPSYVHICCFWFLSSFCIIISSLVSVCVWFLLTCFSSPRLFPSILKPWFSPCLRSGIVCLYPWSMFPWVGCPINIDSTFYVCVPFYFRSIKVCGADSAASSFLALRHSRSVT